MTKAESVSKDLEGNQIKYSDIDIIVEKKVKASQQTSEVLNDDELEDLFESLKQQEVKKKQKI